VSTLQVRRTLLSLLLAALSAAPTRSWAQQALSAHLDASGLIHVTQDKVELALIELNAHGADWQHAPQETATAEVSDLPDRAGKRFVGTLPIPNTDGGAIRFTESVKPLPQGLQLEYDLTMAAAMKLNGLQLSFLLPVTEYAGQEVLIHRPEDEPEIVGLPQEERQGAQLSFTEGAKVEVAKGANGAFTIELRAPTDVVVQDLRQWDRPIFEIRFPAIMEDPPREITPDDSFHLDLTVAFAAPVKLEAP